MSLIASAPVSIGNSTFTQVVSINDQDVVAGATATGAATWQNGQTVSLPGVSGDTAGLATSVNSQGQVVGYSNTGAAYHSLLWQGGVSYPLSELSANSRVYGINDQGVIVGSEKDSNDHSVAVEISNGTVTQLGYLPGGYLSVNNLAVSRAFSVNGQGQVVGISLNASGIEHAVLWQNGGITDLGSIAGGGESAAGQINSHGVIVGDAVDAKGIYQAVEWQNGAMTVLPDHQSNGHSIAYGINDAGIIVGYSDVYTVSSGWQHDAVVWKNGALIDLNSLLPENSGWVLNYAHSINNNGEIVGGGTYNGIPTAFVLSIGDSAGPMMSASAAQQAFAATPHSAALSVLDSAANVQADLTGLEAIASVGKLLQIKFNDTGTPVLTLTSTQMTADAGVVADLTGNFALHVTQETVSGATTDLQNPHVTAVGISDSALWVGSALDQLQSWATAGQLISVSLTDATQNPLYVTAQQVGDDSLALKAIQGSYQLEVTGATLSQAVTFSNEYPVTSVDIADSIDTVANGATQLQAVKGRYSLSLSGTAADLESHYDALASLGYSFTGVMVTDSNFPTVSITAAQDQKNVGLVTSLQGNFVLSIDVSQQAGGIINGAFVPTIVNFLDPAADYVVSGEAGGLQVTDTVKGRQTSNLLFNVTAVQFADGADFVVQAPSSTGETGGNVAELYSAVLARTPDVAGLSYYEHLIQGYQAPTLLQLAEDFLASPEYANNPSHAYAQSAAGDAQFITDTYQNLLHRAPESGAVPYYQAMLAQNTSGLTPGTAAYAAASTQAHAQLLVNFSASGEFLNDVQITAQHPQDAQHWLYVI